MCCPDSPLSDFTSSQWCSLRVIESHPFTGQLYKTNKPHLEGGQEGVIMGLQNLFGFCTIQWMVEGCQSHHLYWSLIFTHFTPCCHNYCSIFRFFMYQQGSHKIYKYLLIKQKKVKCLHSWPLQTYFNGYNSKQGTVAKSTQHWVFVLKPVFTLLSLVA